MSYTLADCTLHTAQSSVQQAAAAGPCAGSCVHRNSLIPFHHHLHLCICASVHLHTPVCPLLAHGLFFLALLSIPLLLLSARLRNRENGGGRW